MFQMFSKSINLRLDLLLAGMGTYDYGEKEVKWKNYHDNRELAEIGNYMGGDKEDEWLIYNKAGQLEKIEHGEEGELIKTEYPK